MVVFHKSTILCYKKLSLYYQIYYTILYYQFIKQYNLLNHQITIKLENHHQLYYDKNRS